MDNFQKNTLFLTGLLLTVGALGLGVQRTCTYIAEERQARREADLKKRWDRVMSMNVAAQFSDKEHERIEKCDGDPEKLRQLLITICRERANFWGSKREEVFKRQLNLIANGMDKTLFYAELTDEYSKASSAEDGFNAACERLKKHNVNEPFSDEKANKPKVKA